MSSSYTINNTANTRTFTVAPGQKSIPGTSLDVAINGMGSYLWGEGVNENFVKLVETFACPAKNLNDYNPSTSAYDYDPSSDPILPKDSNDLGAGFGLNAPVEGQQWFNTSTEVVFIYNSSGEWNPTSTQAVTVSTVMPPIPSDGDLWYDETIPQLKVYHTTGGWKSVADRYLPHDGSGQMTGSLDLNGFQATGAPLPVVASDLTSKDYVDSTTVSSTLPSTKTGSLTLSGDLHMDNSDISVDFGQQIGWGTASTVNPYGSITYLDTHASATGSLMYVNVGPGVDSEFRVDYTNGAGSGTNILRAAGDQFTYKNNTIWHSGNDGSGSGLDADTLDGHSTTAWNDFSGGSVPVRHPSGFLYTNYLNMTANNTSGSSVSRIPVETGTDGYLRWTSPLEFSRILGIGSPPGSIIAMHTTSAPSGYLAATGAAISRTTYAALFAAIGTSAGAGNGTTTFNIPDLRGEFIRGWDAGRGVDGGRVLGSWQNDEFGSHLHPGGATFIQTFLEAGPHPINVQTGSLNTGSTGGNETRPRNVALLYCIKY